MIDLYSTNCPKCKVLIKRLTGSNVPFNLIEDEAQVLEKAKELGIQEVPFVIFNGTLYNFTDAMRSIELFKE